MRRLAGVLALLLLPSAAFAAELFVAPNGDDASPGTKARPLATLRQACQKAKAGDTINLRAGRYPKATYWDSGGDGAPGKEIVIRSADSPRTAKIGAFTLHGRHYVKVAGLDIDGTGGGNAFHVDGHSSHITITLCYVHDAGPDGDCIKVNQSTDIRIEGNEVARPGKRGDGVSYQEGIDFVDVDDSRVEANYVHDFGDMALYTKGGSKNTVIEGNVIAHQLEGGNPATGFGQQVGPLSLMRGADYASYNCVFRNNIIADCPGGAIGTYDCYHGYFYNNTVVNCGTAATDLGIVHQRTSTTWGTGAEDKGRTTGAYFFNNLFLDTRGQMATVYQYRSGHYSDWKTGSNCYYNAGKPVPSTGIVDPNKERGATFGDPHLANMTGTETSMEAWVRHLAPTQESRVLIDKGSSSAKQRPYPAVFHDLWGRPRPRGKGWDIGAFEFLG